MGGPAELFLGPVATLASGALVGEDGVDPVSVDAGCVDAPGDAASGVAVVGLSAFDDEDDGAGLLFEGGGVGLLQAAKTIKIASRQHCIKRARDRENMQ